MWYLCTLPLALVQFKNVRVFEWIELAGSWFGGQAIWLKFAYDLEFVGRNRFVHVWVACLLFMLINTFIVNFLLNKIN